MSKPFRPFRFEVTDQAIAGLHRRIDDVRWPDEVNDEQSSYGLGLPYLRELVQYWRHTFDWRAAEARINALPQFLLELDGLDLHFIHARSPHPDARPLLITHGWPGSIVEFLELIPRLTQPELFGGSAGDAFHVVAPSLQGYGGSPPARAPGMSPRVIAQRHVRLMAALGYARYLVQGGDWGSVVTHCTAALDAEHCSGAHFNLLTPNPPADVADPMGLVQPHELAYLATARHYAEEGSGYYHQQRTRPQTLAYALNDSPVGWCAWVAEKFQAWSDCERDGRRDVRNAISWDAMLTNISLYWYTGTIASSLRLYREQTLADGATLSPKLGGVRVPVGVASYPGEIFRSPKAWAEARYPIVHWYEAPRGGHFAAMEQPQIFAEDLWSFSRRLAAG
jgi:pimeloyl-ACP methyl ester carboxylesterase